MNDLEKLNNKRYNLWKTIIASVRGNSDGSSKWVLYLEQLNRCRFSFEFDECLDLILENEKLIKYGGK